MTKILHDGRQVPVLGGTGPKRGGRQGAGQSAVPGSRYWMYPPCPSVGQGGPTNGLPQPCPKAHPLSLAEATGRIAENQSPATDHCIPGHNLNFLVRRSTMTIHIYECRNVSVRRSSIGIPPKHHPRPSPPRISDRTEGDSGRPHPAPAPLQWLT